MSRIFKFFILSSTLFVQSCDWTIPPDKVPDEQFVPVLKTITGSTFRMGNDVAGTAESPIHQVSLNDFVVNVNETTVKDYKLYCDETKQLMPTAPPWGWDDNAPMVNVTWYEALQYCNWLSTVIGLKPPYKIEDRNVTFDADANGFRLLTEAEWEYIARGANATRNYLYAGSNNSSEVGWFKIAKTQAIKQKLANEVGLYDLSGNAAEWCFDWYEETYYAKSSNLNPVGPDKGTFKIVRGGSFFTDPVDGRVSARNYSPPGSRLNSVGFRICRNR